MKRYFYAMAYFIIIGLVLAAFLINIPFLIMQLMHGDITLMDFMQSLILTPVLALVGGGVFAGIPVAIAGLCMEFYRRYIPNVLLFLLATTLTALALEVGYCQLLNLIREDFIYKLLIVMAITTVIISLYWWRRVQQWSFWEED